MERLTNPKIDLDFYEVRKSGRLLHSGVDDFLKICQRESAGLELGYSY